MIREQTEQDAKKKQQQQQGLLGLGLIKTPPLFQNSNNSNNDKKIATMMKLAAHLFLN